MTTPSGIVLTVGTGQQFSTLSAALAASHDGDTIAVQAGTYTDDPSTVTHSVTIEGVGGFAHFVASGLIPNGKAILLDDAANLTIDNLEFSGAHVDDTNGAGIRYEAGNLTVKNSYFHDNQDGILGGAVTGGNVTIDGSTFVHNGAGDGQTHGAYLGRINSLTVTNSFFQDQLGGSDVKSRAATTLVQNNKFIDTDHSSDTTNYQVDLPEGGNDTVAGNLMLKSTYPNNFAFVHFGGELANPIGTLLVQNNTFFSDRNPSVVVTNQTQGQPIQILNNAIDNFDIPTLINGPTTNTTISGSTTVDIFTQSPATAIVLPAIDTPTLPGGGATSGGGSIASGGGTTTSGGTATGGGGGATSGGGGGGGGGTTVPLAGHYDIGSGTSVLNNLTGSNTIDVTGSGGQISALSGSDVITIEPGVSGPTLFTATGGDHTVTAAAGDNTLSGAGGNDLFSVTGGDNWLGVSSGNNLLTAFDGNDTLMGGSGSDTLSTGGGGSHLLVAGGGHQVISAAAAANTVFTGAGQTVVTLGSGNDSVLATQGNATITAGGGTAMVGLFAGNHQVQLGSGTGFVFALAGQDTVLSGGGQSLSSIGGGSQSIAFTNGSDTLFGGAGSATISGGSGTGLYALLGTDTHLALGSGSTTIFAGSASLDAGLGTGTDVVVTGAGTTTLTVQGGSDTLFVAGSGSLTIKGYDPADLQLVIPHAINGLGLADPHRIAVTHDALGNAVLDLGHTAAGEQTITLVGVGTPDLGKILLS